MIPGLGATEAETEMNNENREFCGTSEIGIIYSCKGCEKHGRCKEICARVQPYADQDYVPPIACQVCDKRNGCSIATMESYACKRIGKHMDMTDPDEVYPDDINTFGVPVIRGSKDIHLRGMEWKVIAFLILTKPPTFYEHCTKVLDITNKHLSYLLSNIRKKLTE
jgi:hypothetical protein